MIFDDTRKNRRGNRRRSAVIAAVLLCVLLCAGLCACGGDTESAGGSSAGSSAAVGSHTDGGSGTEESGGEADGEGAAYKFVKLLSDSDSTYYMKAEVETKVIKENATTKDVVESAQTKDKQMISSESNSYIQYYLSGKQYYFDTLTMKYYEINSSGTAGKVDQAYAPVTGYKETKNAEFNGTGCQCDVYENDAVYDGTKVVAVMEYYVADGKLLGIVSKQRYKADSRLISRVTMTIEEFTTQIPEGTFDLPQGFEKAE